MERGPGHPRTPRKANTVMQPQRLVLALVIIAVGLGYPILVALGSSRPERGPGDEPHLFECGVGCEVEVGFPSEDCRECGEDLEPVPAEPILQCETCDRRVFLPGDECPDCYAPLTPGRGYSDGYRSSYGSGY